MGDGMAPPDPLHLVGHLCTVSSPSRRASSDFLVVGAKDGFDELVAVPDLHRWSLQVDIDTAASAVLAAADHVA
jgi:hypothetical protein